MRTSNKMHKMVVPRALGNIVSTKFIIAFTTLPTNTSIILLSTSPSITVSLLNKISNQTVFPFSNLIIRLCSQKKSDFYSGIHLIYINKNKECVC